MTLFRADLHCHSNCSDGSDDPLTLIDLAHRANLNGLSITDHDTIQAYTPELEEKAKSMGVELIKGVEISTELENLTVHILAYCFDESLNSFLEQVLEKRQERNRLILEKLKNKGMDLQESELLLNSPTQIIGRPHIAKALIKKGYVSTMQEAFDLYLKDSASCYARGGKFTPLDCIEAIHKAKGKAILAHPHFLKRGRYLTQILAHPFDGIECYYGRLYPEQEAPWIQIAKQKNWIATGGSDYHGSMRPNSVLGSSWVGRETFDYLQAR